MANTGTKKEEYKYKPSHNLGSANADSGITAKPPNIISVPILAAAGILGAFIVVLLIWMVSYNMPITADGKGVIYRKPKLFSVRAKADGLVSDLFVDIGDKVNKGQMLAELILSNRQAEAKAALKEKDLASKSQALAYQHIPNQLNQQIISLEKLLSTTNQSIKKQQKVLDKQRSNIIKYKKLLDQGYLSEIEFLKYQEKLVSYESTVGETKGKYNKLLAERASTERKLRDSINEVNSRLADATKTQQVSLNNLNYAKSLSATSSGKVIQISSWEGDAVTKGQELFVISPAKGKLIGTFLVDASSSGRIKIGDKVIISPQSSPAARYGYIEGLVTGVTDYPTDSRALAAYIGSQSLSDIIYKKGESKSPLMVNVELQMKNGKPVWIGSKGPPWPIKSGELATAKITYQLRLPISYISPFIRTITGDSNFE